LRDVLRQVCVVAQLSLGGMENDANMSFDNPGKGLFGSILDKVAEQMGVIEHCLLTQ
jgi:hypothetical protein